VGPDRPVHIAFFILFTYKTWNIDESQKQHRLADSPGYGQRLQKRSSGETTSPSRPRPLHHDRTSGARNLLLFPPQSLDRIEAGGAAGGVEPEEHADEP
jgi:hypothetical protein